MEMERKNWRTYKINLTDDQVNFLTERKRSSGIAISWMLSTAVDLYISIESEKNKHMKSKKDNGAIKKRHSKVK